MPSVQIPVAVEMEDGQTWNVTADQRDVAKYEMQDFYDPARQVTMTRFIAWSASHRKGLTKLVWSAFDAQCVEAGDPPGDEDTVLDPTKPDQSGDNS